MPLTAEWKTEGERQLPKKELQPPNNEAAAKPVFIEILLALCKGGSEEMISISKTLIYKHITTLFGSTIIFAVLFWVHPPGAPFSFSEDSSKNFS